MKTLKPIFIVFGIIIFVIVIALINRNNNKTTNTNSLSDNSNISTTKVETKRIDWSIGSFVDDFGDRTGEKYIQIKTEGTFSNSATSNSFLGVELLFTKKHAGLFLHEYNNNRPAQHFIGNGTISLKNSDGIVVNGYTGSKWNNTGGITLSGGTFTKIKNFLLKSTGQIRVHVQDEYSSTYDFTINADGFAEKFKSL